AVLAQVFKDIDLRARGGRVAQRLPQAGALEPAGRPVPDLLLQPDAALEVAEGGLEPVLGADHRRVEGIARALRGQDQMSLAIERDGFLDVDRIAAWSQAAIVPFGQVERLPVELVGPDELVFTAHRQRRFHWLSAGIRPLP